MSRNWHHEQVKGGIQIGEEWSYTRRVTMINPAERRYHNHAYVLWFGAYGWTRLHVYADSLEDALEGVLVGRIDPDDPTCADADEIEEWIDDMSDDALWRLAHDRGESRDGWLYLSDRDHDAIADALVAADGAPDGVVVGVE